MKLVQKIKLFFFPAVILPFLLVVFLSILIFHGYISMVYDLDDTEKGILEFLNPLSIQNEQIQQTYEMILDISESEPEKLVNKEFLDEIDQSLDATNSYLLMKIEQQVIYRGRNTGHKEIEEDLPDYQERNRDMHTGLYISEPEDFLVRQVNFKTEENNEGTVYILCDLDASMIHYRNIFLGIGAAGIIVLLLTNAIISKFIRREFIKPLQVLEEGINEIKKGNLEQEVPVVREDEIGNVAKSFNEMRDKLKESIDERLRYEEENRILISNISHDLKTPITAIKGYVEGIMDGVATTPEKMERYVQTIYTKAEAMDSMINELSIYSRIDSDSIPYNFKKINLEDFFRQCISELAIDLESEGMELLYRNYCPKDLQIFADTEQLKRVVTNIIINAVKYNDKEKGRIHIRVRQEGEYIQVEIEDNGMGIEEKDLPYIFDRLFRADASRNSLRGGTGLGLAISKKIIEEHGGQIWAKSRKNTGTRIIFTLEIEREETDGRRT